MKLDPSGRKGIFVGYSESLKAYIIYFPGFKKIDISRDVTFDEDSAYIKSRKRPAQELVDPPQEKNPHKWKHAWVREIIQGVERYGALEETHRGRKRTRSCSSYVALLCDIIDKEPFNYEEVAERKEWKDSMIEEY